MDRIAAATRGAPAQPHRTRRPRHDPRETEREILQAAEQLMREQPFHSITVESIMSSTELARSAFYAHFSDKHDLVLRVVAQIGAELFEMSNRWLHGERPREDMRAAFEGIAEVYLQHGPVLTAIADAATSDERVDAAYRALVQSFIDASDEHIRAEQALGRIPAELHAHETARALVWLSERYLGETLGRAPQDDVTRVVSVLEHIWLASLYGD